MDDPHSRLEADLATLRDIPLFVAYNANVDALIRVDSELETHLDRPPGVPGETVPPARLTSKRDLATAIVRSMAAGEGDEIDVSAELASELEAELVPDERQMGGQAGIMTNHLSVLGTAPVLYTYLLSEIQLSLFERPDAVRFPVVENGRVRFVRLDDAVITDRTKTNWIFEFEEGAELFGVRAEANTRFIAASRPPEFDLTADGLDPVIDQVGEAVEGALLAGYHNLTRENIETDYERVHRHARDIVRRLRSGGDLPVHIEYAVTHDDDLRRSFTDLILPEADVVGIDAHELQLLSRDLGVELTTTDASNLNDERPETTILEHYRTLETVRTRLGVACVRLHATDYHIAVMDDYLPSDAVCRGLEFAAVNAAATAASGRIESSNDLERGLAHEPSDAGRDAVDALADDVGVSADSGVLRTPTVVAVPNRIVDDPVGTVGLGDIISSASFALEVAISRAHAADDGE